MEHLKSQLLSQLEKFVADPSDYGSELLVDVFYFCCNCNQASVEPQSLFSEEQLKKAVDLLVQAIPLIDSIIAARVNILGQESARLLRIFRSGLEFIKDYFTSSNAYMEYEFLELLANQNVKYLDKKLDSWKDERAEYDYGNNPIDLRGVPKSHYWWSELERDDSKRKFEKSHIQSFYDSIYYAAKNLSAELFGT